MTDESATAHTPGTPADQATSLATLDPRPARGSPADVFRAKCEARMKCTLEGSGHVREVGLAAYWEVAGDPYSDDYTPDEIAAVQLFQQWAAYIDRLGRYPAGSLPIYWYIWEVGTSAGFLCEGHPLCPNRTSGHDLLTYYQHPVVCASGDRLDWFELPIVDKLWRSGRADKGGFIQEATGWKPSMLQATVSLQYLRDRLKDPPARPRQPTRRRTKPSPRSKTKIGARLRAEVMERDDFLCRRCGSGTESGMTLHVDHVVAVSNGGETVIDNLQTLCGPCNIGKSNRQPVAHDLRPM